MLEQSTCAERHHFAVKIRAMVSGIGQEFVAIGKTLAEAKRTLPHGQWLAFVKGDLPFGPRKAQRLMAIATDTRLTNPTHAPYLPPCWPTLYILTKLSDHEFQAALDCGRINPDMERIDAEALVGLQRAKADDAAADEDRELFKASRVPDPIDEARKAYLQLAQKEPTARRGYELWLLFAALGPTALEKFLRRISKRKNAEEQRILMAKTIAALPDENCTAETNIDT